MSKLGRLYLAQQIVFAILIFLIPTQLGYHIWLPSSYFFGIRVDYFVPTIYLTDLATLALFGLYLLQKIRSKEPVFKKRDFIYLLLFLGLALLNTFLATSFEPSLIKWMKYTELFLLALYIKNQYKLEANSWVLLPLLLSGLFFSSIGIAQFISQKTLGGPFYLLGERAFNAGTPGIALARYFGSYLLRAYSTFSHPNSFAAFLGFLLIAGYFFIPKGPLAKILRWVSLGLGITALYLTLSKWVYISLLMIFSTIYLKKQRVIDIRKIIPWILGSVVVASLLLTIFSNKILEADRPFSEAFLERLYLAKRAGDIVVKNPLIGVGLNNYILNLPRSDVVGFSWELQPVHNIFLLTFSEVGLIGLLVFTLLLAKGLQNSKGLVFWALLFIVFSGFADHYWLTLQQNQLIFTLVLGLALRET